MGQIMGQIKQATVEEQAAYYIDELDSVMAGLVEYDRFRFNQLAFECGDLAIRIREELAEAELVKRQQLHEITERFQKLGNSATASEKLARADSAYIEHSQRVNALAAARERAAVCYQIAYQRAWLLTSDGAPIVSAPDISVPEPFSGEAE